MAKPDKGKEDKKVGDLEDCTMGFGPRGEPPSKPKTLPEAIKCFESLFEEIIVTVEDRPVDPLVCSGGTVSYDSILPALYSSTERAIEAWFDTATSLHTYSHAKLWWLTKPELIEFQVTIADRLGQHRLVGNRYAVRSQYRTS